MPTTSSPSPLMGSSAHGTWTCCPSPRYVGVALVVGVVYRCVSSWCDKYSGRAMGGACEGVGHGWNLLRVGGAMGGAC